MRNWVIALLLVGLSFPALAARVGDLDGTVVSGQENINGVNARPDSVKYYLCRETDGDASEAGTCGTTDIQRPGVSYMFTVDEGSTGDNCEAFSVSIEHSATSTGEWHILDTLDWGLDTAVQWDAPLSRYLRGVITSPTACDALDVIVEVFYGKP